MGRRYASPEDDVQRDVLSFCAAHGVMAAAVPNGAVLAGDATQRARQMNALKRSGLVPGFPDLVLIGPHGRVAFVEVKAEGGRLSPDQKRIGEWLIGTNHNYAVVRSLDDIKDSFFEWGWCA